MGTFLGSLDSASCERVEGWVWDESRPEHTLTVAVYINGKKAAQGTAQHFREDLHDHGISDGCKAFSINLPTSLKVEGEANVAVVVEGSDYQLQGSPRRAVFPPLSQRAGKDPEEYSADIVRKFAATHNFCAGGIDDATPVNINIDVVRFADDNLCLIEGWVASDFFDRLSLLLFVDGDYYSIDTKRIVTWHREDVRQHFANSGRAKKLCNGFIALCRVPENKNLRSVKVCCLSEESRCLLLRDAAPQGLGKTEALAYATRCADLTDSKTPEGARVIAELIDTFALKETRRSAMVKDRYTYNADSGAAFSFVIPLYAKWHFVKYHLPLFEDLQRSIGAIEVVYVVDDVRLRKPLRDWLTRNFIGFSFRLTVLELEENYGFAKASNAGAAEASGDLLLFMNSDVYLKNTRHFQKALLDCRMRAQTQSIGAIGFQLHFEDDTIQHDGISMMPSTELYGFPLPDHDRKGLPTSLLPMQKSSIVVDTQPVVTGALLGLSVAAFRDVGGFPENYYIGDFEDVDLCYRLSARGYRNVIYRMKGLYHLERQSFSAQGSGSERYVITLRNCYTFASQQQLTS